MSAQLEEQPFWLKDNFAPVFDEVTETNVDDGVAIVLDALLERVAD